MVIAFSFILNAQNPIDNYLSGDYDFTVIGNTDDGVYEPRDIEFHPDPAREYELWILNIGGVGYSNNTQYYESVCVPQNTDVTFTIYDSYGDGICCSYGNGAYEVDICGTTVASGGNFGTSESSSFNSGFCPFDGCDADEVEVVISILTDNYGSETSWDVIDDNTGIVYGKKVESGGSTVTYYNTGLPEQTSEYRKDSFSGHFMHTASAFSFGDNGNFANTLEVQDANNNPGGLFSGSTLWDSDTSIYARVNQNGPQLGSHIDMIHQSPYSMGIEHEEDNVYWLFDGQHHAICRYDFHNPHSYGGDNHSDGEVWRFSEVYVTREPGVPSHLVLDHSTDWLYIVDSGNQRILRLNTNSGTIQNNLSPYGESLAGYYNMNNADWEIYIDEGLEKPCGIDLYEDRLIVSDNQTAEIIIYDISSDSPEELGRLDTDEYDSLMGITIGPDFNIWFVNFNSHEVIRIDNDILMGDVNFDEAVDILDIVMIVNHILGINELDPAQFNAGDMDDSGIVNVLDIIQIINIILS